MEIDLQILREGKNKEFVLELAKKIKLQRSETINIRYGEMINTFKSEKEFSDFLVFLENKDIAKLKDIQRENSHPMTKAAFRTFCQNDIPSGLDNNDVLIFECNEKKIKQVIVKIPEKTKIYISQKHGIYTDPDNKNGYGIKGAGSKMIWLLQEGQKTGEELKGQINFSNFCSDIKRINKLFKKSNGGLDYDLIKKLKTGGYELNRDEYEIKFIEENQ